MVTGHLILLLAATVVHSFIQATKTRIFNSIWRVLMNIHGYMLFNISSIFFFILLLSFEQTMNEDIYRAIANPNTNVCVCVHIGVSGVFLFHVCI